MEADDATYEEFDVVRVSYESDVTIQVALERLNEEVNAYHQNKPEGGHPLHFDGMPLPFFLSSCPSLSEVRSRSDKACYKLTFRNLWLESRKCRDEEESEDRDSDILYMNPRILRIPAVGTR